jgi:hypothetical protein
LNLDSLGTKEREEVVFRMKKQLEQLSELAPQNESFFSAVGKTNALQTQFNIWKRNLFVPLHDQLEEQAKRKIEEIEQKKIEERDKDIVWNAEGAKRDLFDPEREEQRNQRHQAILRQHLAEERRKQGLDVGEVE